MPSLRHGDLGIKSSAVFFGVALRGPVWKTGSPPRCLESKCGIIVRPTLRVLVHYLTLSAFYASSLPSASGQTSRCGDDLQCSYSELLQARIAGPDAYRSMWLLRHLSIGLGSNCMAGMAGLACNVSKMGATYGLWAALPVSAGSEYTRKLQILMDGSK